MNPEEREQVRHFAARLRGLRVSRGLTLTDVAEQAGFSRPHLHRIESGDVSPTWHVVLRLCEFYDVGPEYFAG